MDDKNKYNNALEKLQESLAPKDGREISGLTRGCIESIFPELKESDDERIRKEIIEYIKTGTYHKDWIAWLEKQSEQNPIINVPSREVILSIWDLGNEWNKLTNGSISTEFGNAIDYIQKHWHESEYYLRENKAQIFKKQESIDENKIIKRIKTDIATSLINYINANSKGMYLSDIECEDIEDAVVNNKWYKVYNYMKKELEKQEEKPQGKTALEAVREEKIDNANKVEPKFKVGDWLCENEPNNYARFIQILEIVNVLGKERYRISRDFHNDEDIVEFDFAEKYYHKFGIADAKDGDLLYSLDSKQPFIFKHRKTHEQAEVYCGINIYGKFFVGNTKDCIITTDKYIPATKEQRDKLLKAMTDAGWQFDFEKKELKGLKKIEDESEDCKQQIMSEMADLIKDYIRQKPDWWSEEDKNFMYDTLGNLTELKDRYGDGYGNVGKCIEWLKSIKQRCTWKPSEEQMCAFKQVYDWHNNNLVPSETLTSLYNDLKKLK